MSESVVVSAAVVIGASRLRSYLAAPVVPASAWAERDWHGVCDPWGDSGRYRAELPGAVAECDRWLEGDYAGLLRGLDEDGLALAYDEVTGSLALDFEARVDFRLPSLVWACAVLRGMAGFLAGDDAGLVTVTADWEHGAVLLGLSPDRSVFLDPGRDAAALAAARDAEFDVRCAVPAADPDESAADVVARLLAG